MSTRIPFTLIVFVALLTPLAAASGQLDAGPAHVALQNGHTSDCFDPSGLCLASMTGASPGDTAVDANQEIRYVHVWVDAPEGLPEHELLPDGNFVVRRESLEVPNPVFRILTEEVGGVRGPGPLRVFAFRMEEHGQYGESYRLGDDPLREPLVRDEGYAPYSEDGAVEYESVGPSRDYGEASTRDAFVLATDICAEVTEASCASDASNATIDSMPEVRYGLEFHQIGAGTAPPPPGSENARPARPMDDSPLARVASALPAAPEVEPRLHAAPVVETALTEAPGPARPHGPPRAAPPDGRVETATAEREMGADWPHIAGVAAGAALALAALAAYSRVAHRERVLLHERRLRILSLLTERGPMGFAALRHELSVDRTTVEHHARMLEKAGHVRIERVARELVVALPRQPLPPAPATGAAAATALLVRVLEEAGGVMHRAALREASATLPTRRRNLALAQLAATGRIERAFSGTTEVIRLAARPAGGA